MFCTFSFSRAVRFLLNLVLLRGAAFVVAGLALASAGRAAQFTLRWQDNSSNESGFHVEGALGSGAFAQVTSTGANVVSYTDNGLSDGMTYRYRVRAFNSAGASGYSNIVTATAGSAPSTPPASAGNLTAGDIGGPAPGGSTSFDASAGAYTLRAGGRDIWDGSDQFRFAQQQISGDATLVVRVNSLGHTDQWAKAGLMLRSSLAANSPHVSVFVTPANGVVMQWRSQSGQTSFTSDSASGAAPRWLRLQRQGNTFTASQSSNGSQWQQVHQPITLALGSTVYGGLAVTSHRDGTATTAGFDQLAVTSGSGAPPPSSGGGSVLTGGDIGGPAPGGSTAFDASAGVYTLRAGGRDIWDGSDQFHFAQRQIAGDTDLAVRVNSLVHTDQWAKAGLMLRSSLAANSPHVSVFVTPANGVVMQWRSQSGQTSFTTNSTSGAAPRWLRLQRQGNTFTGYYSDNGAQWSQIHRVTVSLASSAYGGLAVTSHTNGTATTAAFRSLSIPNVTGSSSSGSTSGNGNPTTGGGSGSATLASTDIGSPAKTGQTWTTSTGHEISAGGWDIWDTSDQLHFAHHQASGDAEMTVRVKSLANSDQWAKAGLMFRGSLAANSAHVSVFVTPSNGVVLQWRNANGAMSSTSSSINGAAPKWLRLLRTGNTFYAFHSHDGASWDLVDYVQVNLPSTTYAGLAVTSHHSGTTTYAVFEGFRSD